MILVVETDSPIARGGKLVENLGIETLGGTFTMILAAGTPVPSERTEIFSTAADGQQHVAVRLYRGGSSSTVSKAHWLGEVRVAGFPGLARGVPKLAVTFRVIANRVELEVPEPLEITSV